MEFAGNKRVVSHYQWQWKSERTHSFPPVVVHRRVQVPVYTTRPTYRNVPTDTKRPVYGWKNVEVKKWVQVRTSFWQCGR